MNDDSRWYVNYLPEDKYRTYSDFYFGMVRITWPKESDLEQRPQRAVTLYAGESNELRDFITELVHEIERLQGENIKLNDEVGYMRYEASLPVRPPYPHGNFRDSYT